MAYLLIHLTCYPTTVAQPERTSTMEDKAVVPHGCLEDKHRKDVNESKIDYPKKSKK